MEKINVAELLKDCPKGMELDCTMYDGVLFEYVSEGHMNPIKIQTPDGLISLTKYGCYSANNNAKCVIFPKGKTTWEGFHKPFKEGDIIYILSTNGIELISIFKTTTEDRIYSFGDLSTNTNRFIAENINGLIIRNNINIQRLATEEEKKKLFDAIKENGYKWNAETKTLNKLVVPNFKVGDRIRHKVLGDIYCIKEIRDTCYITDVQIVFFEHIDNWCLVEKFDIATLKPFESRILVRDYDNQIWIPTFWGRYFEETSNCRCLTINGCYKYCIPYECNEHLLGTTDDCEEFYKTWEK